MSSMKKFLTSRPATIGHESHHIYSNTMLALSGELDRGSEKERSRRIVMPNPFPKIRKAVATATPSSSSFSTPASILIGVSQFFDEYAPTCHYMRSLAM
ncbi:uncharacterized protein Z519_02571 [Cladophialophora bantiana CBS 173.52]|uniref:Uncharacterized protein n=1 Tax=Cladophialophora bantiana (strain ATCC 10958 / CBS 173.52 / CDC B-1940 / NIH 8579) TaxID=1442370 RepID=A0A0D2IK40_CLAB1|nr:uncharacterized protein Z519_02571 [Cladophialophora bantiana CBS 173.52]KIW97179.1 hypothetical protein Z519_02571 [Cladophialophora bantiana CBS 173.52]